MKVSAIIAVGAFLVLIAVGSLAFAGYAASQVIALAREEIGVTRTEAEVLRQATASLPKYVTPIPYEDMDRGGGRH